MKVRKSRKEYYEKPLHLRKKDVKIHLSKELKEKLKTNKRNVVARKGDRVKIIRGKYKGNNGKIIKVSYKERKIYVEGIAHQTARGIEKAIPLEPSNAILLELNLNDNRKKKLNLEG